MAYRDQQSWKVLIVDDQEVFRTGLIFGLREHDDIEIVGEAENGQQAIDLTEQLKPDVVLTGIPMPVMDGITVTQTLKQNNTDTRVIILASSSHEEEIVAALGSSADGYCIKDVRLGRLQNVISVVTQGDIWLAPAIATIILRNIPPPGSAPGSPTQSGKKSYRADITPQEQGILRLLAAGNTYQDVAEQLGISVQTVTERIGDIVQKLADDDRTQSAIKVIQAGTGSADA